MIVLDTETEPFGPARMAPPLVVLTVGGADGAALVHHSEAAEVGRALLTSGETLVGLNMAYDLAVLAEDAPDLLPLVFAVYDAGRVVDVGIRQRLVDLAAGNLGFAGGLTTNGGWSPGGRSNYSLAELARRHLDVELPKGDVRTSFRRGVPLTPEQRTYAELDVVMTAHLEPLVPSMPDEQRQAAAAWWVHLMHCWGMTTDPAAVATFARMAQENYERLSKALVDVGLKRPDRQKRDGEWIEGSRDTKRAMELLVAAYERKGVAVPRTNTGKPCLDEESCQRSGDPLLRTYADFASASKVLSADVKLVSRAQPIHANFNVLLETGDIGCSNPNLVNLPTRPGVRECFVPPEGFVFLACDYAAIQLRTWAQVCITLFGKSDMADVLNAGGDPHTMFAAAVLGISYEEAKAKPKKEIYFPRQCGKVNNFGRPGGMGDARLVHAAMNQYGVEITLEQSRSFGRVWRRRWREADPYLEWVRQRAGDRGSKNARVEQLFSGRIRGGMGYCDLANTLFSALSYDAIKDAGYLVARECYIGDGPLHGSRIVNVIHDELLMIVPEDTGHECALEASRLMVLAAEKWIPDVPAKVEATLMRRWSKGAEPTYENGRLVPWGD